MSSTTTPDHLSPFSPAWYAWHAEHPAPSAYDRVMGAVLNGTVGALMSTVGYGVGGPSVVEQDATTGAEPVGPGRPRRSARRALGALVALLLPVAALVALSVPSGAVAAPVAPVAAVCEGDASCAAWDASHGVISTGGPEVAEDDPAFSCSTEGNLQCGLGAEGGPLVAAWVPGAPAYVFCPVGGELLTNGAGVQVCDYSSVRGV